MKFGDDPLKKEDTNFFFKKKDLQPNKRKKLDFTNMKQTLVK